MFSKDDNLYDAANKFKEQLNEDREKRGEPTSPTIRAFTHPKGWVGLGVAAAALAGALLFSQSERAESLKDTLKDTMRDSIRFLLRKSA